MIPTQYVGFSERPKFMGATWGQFSYHKHLRSTGRDVPSITEGPLLDLNAQPHMHNCQTLGFSKRPQCHYDRSSSLFTRKNEHEMVRCGI